MSSSQRNIISKRNNEIKSKSLSPCFYRAEDLVDKKPEYTIEQTINNLQFIAKNKKNSKKKNRGKIISTIKERNFLFLTELKFRNKQNNNNNNNCNKNNNLTNLEVTCSIFNIKKLTYGNDLEFLIRKYLKYSLSIVIVLFIYLFMGIICREINTKFGKNAFTIIFLPVFNFFVLELGIIVCIRRLISSCLLFYCEGAMTKYRKTSLIGSIMIPLIVPDIEVKHFKLIKLFNKIYKKI